MNIIDKIPLATQPKINKAHLVERLGKVLPNSSLLHKREELKPFECDGMTAYRKVPLVTALPETEEQVIDILKICSAEGVPVVFRGAGTGLSGGAIPCETGVLLGLSKLNKILEIEEIGGTPY